MRVLHSYCLNYNIGDYALGIGVKNILRKHLNIDYIGETNIQGRYFTEYYINEVINKKYDLLVIGGGGLIHGAHWPNGWFWLIDKELIKTIKIPYIIYGVGNNYWDNELIPERAILHLEEAYKHATHFSVRNDGSLERTIKQVSFIPEEVPDPGFFVNLDSNYGWERKIKEKYVIIQIANDKADQRIGNAENTKNFVDQIRTLVKMLSREYKVLMAPHVFEDISMSKQIIEGIENTDIWDFSYYAFDNVRECLGYYKFADFVLSMRGHGQIVPIGFNVPTIALTNHPKHKGLMDKLLLSEWAVNISDSKFLDIINEKIICIKKEKVILRKQLAKTNDLLLKQMDKSFDKLKVFL